jgi:hypothetical protein
MRASERRVWAYHAGGLSWADAEGMARHDERVEAARRPTRREVMGRINAARPRQRRDPWRRSRGAAP